MITIIFVLAGLGILMGPVFYARAYKKYTSFNKRQEAAEEASQIKIEEDTSRRIDMIIESGISTTPVINKFNSTKFSYSNPKTENQKRGTGIWKDIPEYKFKTIDNVFNAEL